MTKTQALKALKAAGTAQTRKIYGRHGVTDPMYGVSYAAFGKLKKQIGVNHALAESLWATGNHDARVLSCMIGDSAQAGRSRLNAAVREINDYILADAFSGYVGRGPFAEDRAMKWKSAKHEFTGQVGWNLIAGLAMRPEGELTNGFFLDRLKEVEAGIGTAKNRVRHSMNQAVIAIGIRNTTLRKRAEAAAKRIGVVEVDHGQTSCTTPPAIPYIAKTWARKNNKAKKR